MTQHCGEPIFALLSSPYYGKFLCHQIFRGISRTVTIHKNKKYFPIFHKLVLRNWWRLWLQFAVITSLKLVFTCVKASDMQLSQNNNLSLQAIWLEVNWIMTESIFPVPRWIIFVCWSFYSLAFQVLWQEIFFPHSWSIEGKLIFAEQNRNYYSRALVTVKIKIREK